MPNRYAASCIGAGNVRGVSQHQLSHVLARARDEFCDVGQAREIRGRLDELRCSEGGLHVLERADNRVEDLRVKFSAMRTG